MPPSPPEAVENSDAIGLSNANTSSIRISSAALPAVEKNSMPSGKSPMWLDSKLAMTYEKPKPYENE